MRIVGTQMTWIAILIYALVVNQRSYQPLSPLNSFYSNPISLPQRPKNKNKKPPEKPRILSNAARSRILLITHPLPPSHPLRDPAFIFDSQDYGGRSHTKHPRTHMQSTPSHKSAPSNSNFQIPSFASPRKGRVSFGGGVGKGNEFLLFVLQKKR